MPELPEVETIRRQLEPLVRGRTITEGWGHESAKFRAAPAASGHRVEGVGRRGKYLIASLDRGRELVVHLGMTGSLGVDASPPDDGYLRAWWSLDDGSVLWFRDVRRFGRLAVVRAGDYDALPTLAAIGPEPFDPSLTGEAFWRALRNSSQRIKTQLLSQRPIAGVGNIYADEALWAAGIHPGVRRVSRTRAAALLDALRDALGQGIEHGGTTIGDYRSLEGEGTNQHRLAAYGRAGEPCLRCGTTMSGSVLDGRSTSWCRICQTR